MNNALSADRAIFSARLMLSGDAFRVSPVSARKASAIAARPARC
jgi:hypothetical protein